MISLFWKGFLSGGFICGFIGIIVGMLIIHRAKMSKKGVKHEGD